MYDERADMELHCEEVRTCMTYLAQAGWEKALDSRVLDVGGGLAGHAGFLTSHFSSVTCTDLRHYLAEYGGTLPHLLREKFLRFGVTLDLSSLELMYADAMNLPFRDCWFDSVVSFNAFEHIPSPRAALYEMLRVLRPSGLLYGTFDPIWTADSGSHFSWRLPEPWLHLIIDTEAFESRLLEGGGTHEEAHEFRHAMNRRRLDEYETMIDEVVGSGLAQLAEKQTWEGFCDASFETHPNYSVALSMGFSDRELRTRGMRFVLRKI